jgi:putative membrane protein
MKTRLFVLLLAALAAGPVAAQVSTDATAARPGTPKTALGTGDAEAIATLSAVNQHEIAAAQLAKNKGVGTEVAEYAAKMDAEHSNNQRQTDQLAASAGVKPAETDKVRALKTKTEGERDKLASLSGKEFEKAYVQAMVKDHTEVLAKIDKELLPAASNAAVKEHLQKTRDHVAHHLEEARRLDAQSTASADEE